MQLILFYSNPIVNCVIEIYILFSIGSLIVKVTCVYIFTMEVNNVLSEKQNPLK